MPYRDEFDDPYSDKSIASTVKSLRRQLFLKTRGPAMAAGVLVTAAVLLAGVVFFTYPGSDDAADSIPVIQADAQPFKISPEEPGGMDIPNRDSTVFSSLRSSRQGGDESIENLLAEDESAETPLPRSQLFAGLNTQDEAQDHIDEEMAAKANGTEPAAGAEELLNEGIDESSLSSEETPSAKEIMEEVDEQFSSQKIEEVQPVEKVEPIEEISASEETSAPVPLEEVTPAVEEVEEEKVASISESVKSEPVPVKPQPGSYYIQLGAVQSAEAAEKGWGSFKKEFSPLLSDFDHRVERADLGAKGIYYRIQAGPVSKQSAASVCESIKAKKPGGCIIVGP